MDILELLNKHSIETRITGKNVSYGWVGINCPFCITDTGFHGGFTLTKPIRYYCWKCNSNNPIRALSKILSLPYNTIVQIIEEDIESTTQVDKIQVGTKP